MARKPRDYKAEYARRNRLAEERGFRNYAQQRSLIEKGIAPAINPFRLRKRSTIEAQEIGPGFLGKTIHEYRVENAERWSEVYRRSDMTKFDEERAMRDPAYLDTYTQAFMVTEAGIESHYRRLEPSQALHDYLVGEGHMTEEEYQNRYGETE
ncbi:MAG TPA: hypothetical protein VIY48_02520 [Candidatus Paceibacterota bacterium]|jgi:hypothetical protein